MENNSLSGTHTVTNKIKHLHLSSSNNGSILNRSTSPSFKGGEKWPDNTKAYSIANNWSPKTNTETRGLIRSLIKSASWDQENMTFYPPPYQLDLLNGSSKHIKYLCQNSTTTFNQSTSTALYYCVDGINELKAANVTSEDSICVNGEINGTDCFLPIPRITITLLDIVIAVFLSAFIICIIIGNILVVSSVVLFRDMRTLTNALIVSLAIADLLVALIVLPISLHFEITDHLWTLSPILCEFWITADVFCCTASILNIVVIAMDRYWLITRNVRYTHNVRFPRKRVCIVMVTLAWALSTIISVSPLIGWTTGHIKSQGRCIISQDLGYTIFSTFGAFWFPLSVILITYFKIFKIARKRAQSRAKSRSICPSINTSTYGTDVGSLKQTKHSDTTSETTAGSMASKSLLEHQDNEHNDVQDISAVEDKDCNKTEDNHCYTTVNNNTYMETSINSVEPPPHTQPQNGNSITDVTIKGSKKHTCDNSIVENNFDNNHSTSKANGEHSKLKRNSTNSFAKSSYFKGKKRRQFQRLGQCRSSRMRYRNRMRSSARTLGLIIGCFVMCWMPFFLIATVTPFCEICDKNIPGYVFSIGLWLGYSNSLLNPAIYAIWDKNFRRSFKKILKCHINWSYVF